MREKLILLLVSLTLIISCSVSQQNGEESSETRLADMVLTNGRFTLYQKDERPIVFTSSRASFYAADNSAEIDEIAFSQHDENGELTLEGSADYGELNTEDKRLMLKGNVRLESMESGMLIISEGPLFFDAESQEIETEAPSFVSSSDGEFSSSGFYGNLLNEEYSFSSLNSGRILI